MDFLCTSTVYFYMLVNSEATKFSLAQGGFAKVTHYPSSFLFLETLSRIVNKAIEVSLLEGFLVTNSQAQSQLISTCFLLMILCFCFFCANLRRAIWVF